MDLNALCCRLDELGRKRPNQKARIEVEQALSSKWEGVRVTAARTLASWGDERSLSLIREFLVKMSQKEAAWATTGALANALAPRLAESDLDWVFDVFLSKARQDNRYALISLFEAFDPKISIPALEARLTKAKSDAASDLRMVLGRVKWRATDGCLTTCMDSSHK